MARINRDNVDKFYDYDIELSTKTLYMGSVNVDSEDSETGTDFAMAERMIKGLHILDNKDTEKPINIIMNNLGGDWVHGMAIYDAIKACKSHVIITVYGHAMSMGSVILQAADERILTPNTDFMIHYGRSGASGHSKNFEKWGDYTKRIDYKMENIYLDKMMKKDEEEEDERYLETVLADIVNRQKELEYPPPDRVKYKFSLNPDKRREDVRKVLKSELLNFDSYLTAEETVKLGLADEIL